MLQEIIENWGGLSDEDKWVIVSILRGDITFSDE